jgi:predicted RNA-binding protein YlxR (DUF448 family)
VRIVRRPDGSAVLDPTGRLSGRGAYLCADGTCWSLALKRHSLERALELTLPAELQAQLATGAPPSIEGGNRGS